MTNPGRDYDAASDDRGNLTLRTVPGVGQFTVPDDHPELVAFLYQATRNFGCAN